MSRLIQPFMGDTAEFHLRSYDTSDDAIWRRIAEQYDLREVILHAPFRKHNLEDVCLSQTLRPEVMRYILRQCDYAESAGINVHILFHVSYPVESARNLSFYKVLDSLLTPLEQTIHLSLLVENTIISLDLGKKRLQEEPITEILKNTPPELVGMCFDLCHYLASKNVVQDEYAFPPIWGERIFSVHFSETRFNEGYKHFVATHGRRHDSKMGVARDLCLLKDLGVNLDTARIVTEITEGDYDLRPEEAQELAWLHQLNMEGLAF